MGAEYVVTEAYAGLKGEGSEGLLLTTASIMQRFLYLPLAGLQYLKYGLCVQCAAMNLLFFLGIDEVAFVAVDKAAGQALYHAHEEPFVHLEEVAADGA